MTNRNLQWIQEAKIISKILSNAPEINKEKRIELEEFKDRQSKLIKSINNKGIDAAIVYSDEHYNGDVPYLAGNTNITVEPVAGVIGKNGFHLIAGLEGGYVAEQLIKRSGILRYKCETLKLADEEYPVEGEKIEDIIEEAAGGKPAIIGLLTPREVLPLSIYEIILKYMGDSKKIIDAQELYYEIKYEKSDNEISLIREASLISDVILECMLAVIKPGMLETQVAQWGYAVGCELGIEEWGFDIMVTSNEANRTLIGKALNRKINEGDVVSLGVGPKRDGLNACQRGSVVCVKNPKSINRDQKYWFSFLEEAFKVGLDAFINISKNNLPAKIQEQALVDFFLEKQVEVQKKIGKNIDFLKLKPYTGTHNTGYTECQEFYGAITLNSEKPLGKQIAMMLDVAVKGIGNKWDEVIIPGLDFILIEKTLGKFNKEVEVMTKLPLNLQKFVWK
ncbi:MAG: M24 family metallopeptidase [Actinobacteria bacterium]|nr:M24 family metallopeptidase [Actinomycetota bacterium]